MLKEKKRLEGELEALTKKTHDASGQLVLISQELLKKERSVCRAEGQSWRLCVCLCSCRVLQFTTKTNLKVELLKSSPQFSCSGEILLLEFG